MSADELDMEPEPELPVEAYLARIAAMDATIDAMLAEQAAADDADCSPGEHTEGK